jgi:DUF4097 and DUF4098 domain-containing protein YvlB
MTKRIKKMSGIAMALFLLFAAISGGYAEGEFEEGELLLVNTLNPSLGGIENLNLESGGDEMIIRESATGELVIREYMKKDRPKYYVQVSRSGGTLTVKRPWWPWPSKLWTRARIEIDLPRSFRENIRIGNGSGILRTEMDLLDYRTIDLSVSSGSASFRPVSGKTVSIRVASGSLNMDSVEGDSFISLSSGRLQIGALSGGEHRIKGSSGNARIGAIRGNSAIDISSGHIAIESIQGDAVIEVSSGNLQIDELNGQAHRFKGSSGVSVIGKTRGRVEGQLSSGSLTMGDFFGEGNFTISSGNINLDLRELLGNLEFNLTSGNIDLSVPRDLSFNLDAVTRSGEILVDEGREGTVRIPDRSTVLRPFGPSPSWTIYARTNSGSLNIKRAL